MDMQASGLTSGFCGTSPSQASTSCVNLHTQEAIQQVQRLLTLLGIDLLASIPEQIRKQPRRCAHALLSQLLTSWPPLLACPPTGTETWEQKLCNPCNLLCSFVVVLVLWVDPTKPGRLLHHEVVKRLNFPDAPWNFCNTKDKCDAVVKPICADLNACRFHFPTQHTFQL